MSSRSYGQPELKFPYIDPIRNHTLKKEQSTDGAPVWKHKKFGLTTPMAIDGRIR